MGPRLVMLSAASPGAGKSSVMTALAARASPPVLEIAEDDVWGTRELGDRPVDVQTAREDFREVVFGVPRDRVGAVLRLFGRLVDECVATGSLWLQDWTWPDLVRLSWREGSEQEMAHVSARLRMMADPLRPLVLHLKVDPELALRRALAERGDVWFNRHFTRGLTDQVDAAAIRAGAAMYAADSERRLGELCAAGWNVLPINEMQAPGDVATEAWAVVASTAG